MGGCPHYSTEQGRRPVLHSCVLNGSMPTTIAIDDGVAVLFENGCAVDVYCALETAHAYTVSRTEAKVIEDPLRPS